MAIYVSVVWTTGDVLTETKLDNMVSNDQSETAHSANGMIMNNNVAYSAKQAGGATKDVMKLGTDDLLRLSQIRYDDDGTPATKENVIIQTGWGWIIGDGTDTIEESVSFPTAFTTVLGVTITHIGRKIGSNPSSVIDFDGAASSWINVTAIAISASGFEANLRHIDEANLVNTNRFGYFWTAWGTKS